MAILVYSTPSCAYCRMVKEFLKEHHLEYEEINVADDQTRTQEMIKKSGQMGVPVIAIPAELSQTKKEEIVIGFDPQKLKIILGL